MSLPLRLPDGSSHPSLAAAARALGITRQALHQRRQRDPAAYAEPVGTVGATCAGAVGEIDGGGQDGASIQVDEY